MNDLDHLPPQNLDAERAVLGGIMLVNDVLRTVAAALTPTDFYLPEHQAIFRCMLAMADKGRPVDLVTMTADLAEQGDLDRIGGSAYLVDLLERTPLAANVEHYTLDVAKASMRRKLSATGKRLAARAQEWHEDTEEAMVEAEAAIRDARGACTHTDKDGLPQLAERAKALLDGTGESWPSNLTLLDGYPGGLTAGSTLVIGGRSRHGKRALSVGLMLATLEAGRPVMSVRYEEVPEGIILRLASRLSGVPYADMQVRRASPEERDAFTRWLDWIASWWKDCLIIERGERIERIEARAEAWRPDYW